MSGVSSLAGDHKDLSPLSAHEQKYESVGFDLTKIKKFNPGLIYGADFETPFSAQESKSQQVLTEMFGIVEQYQGMFYAYLYAQNIVLATIQKQGIAAITDEQLITWCNQIHKRIAATIDLPGLTKKFIAELLIVWKRCDKNDSDQVVQLVFAAFHGLIAVDPDVNANGRMATCLLNIILCSLGYPSIMMRYPTEGADPNSSYIVAMREIHTNPQLLIEHIKLRLQISAGYEDSNLAEVIAKKIALVKIMRALKNHVSIEEIERSYLGYMSAAADMTAFISTSAISAKKTPSMQPMTLSAYNELMKECNGSKLASFSLQAIQHGCRVFPLDYCLMFFSKLQKEIIAKQEKSLALAGAEQQPRPGDKRNIIGNAVPVSPVVQYQYTEQDKQDAANKLKKLTGCLAAVSTPKGSLVVFLKVEDEKSSAKIAVALQKTGALQAESTAIKAVIKENVVVKERELVIRVTCINLEKLNKIMFLEGLKMSSSTAALNASSSSG